jgi:hypothetical protein
MGHQAEMIAVDSVDEAIGRAADPRRLFRNRVKHRLEVAGGARECAQDLNGGGKLLADSCGARRGRYPGFADRAGWSFPA